MMEIVITTSQLAGHSELQGIKSFVTSKGSYTEENMDYFITLDASVALAKDGEVIVGVAISISLDDHPSLTSNRLFMKYIEGSAFKMNELLTPITYVDEGYTGRRIASKLALARCQFSLNKGYKAQVNFGYSTREILAYTWTIDGNLDTGAVDHAGDPILIRTLEDTIKSIVAKGVTLTQ